MIVPLEPPLFDPEVAPLDVAPESDPLAAPLPVPEPAPLPEPDAELPLAPTRFPLLPPFVPLLPADPEEPPSSDAAPVPDELEPLPHPPPAAQAKAASDSDVTKVDRRMDIPPEPAYSRDRLKAFYSPPSSRAAAVSVGPEKGESP